MSKSYRNQQINELSRIVDGQDDRYSPDDFSSFRPPSRHGSHSSRNRGSHGIIFAFLIITILLVVCIFRPWGVAKQMNNGSRSAVGDDSNVSYSEHQPPNDDILFPITPWDEQTYPNDSIWLEEANNNVLSSRVMSDNLEKNLRFYRSRLSETDKLMYDQIAQSILLHQPSLDHIQNYSLDRLFDLYALVLQDYPEFFWIRRHINGVTHTGQDNYCTLNYDYVYTKEEAVELVDRVDHETTSLLQSLSDKSEYDKVKSVYEYLITQTTYDNNYFDDQSMLSVLLEHRGVCAGYSRSMQYLLNQLGIQALFVEGVATNTDGVTADHSWNIVRIEDEYYHVDATWGDPVPKNGESEVCVHDYLNVTTEEIMRTRSASPDFYIPFCDSVRFNYFVQEQNIFDRIDEECLTTLLLDSAMTGQRCEMKFSDSNMLDAALYELFGDPNEIINYMDCINESLGLDYHTAWYDIDAPMCCMRIWFTA